MKNEVDQALHRARKHLRISTVEAFEGARALLEAAMHSSGLTSASPDSLVGQIQRQLDDVIAALRGDAPLVMPRALAKSLGGAIDAEIKRWERLSQTDSDARLVLRAFLALREFLWEIGMHVDEAEMQDEPRSSAQPDNPEARDRDRVQRFEIDE